MVSYQLSVVSYQLSVVSYQLSVVSYQWLLITVSNLPNRAIIAQAYSISSIVLEIWLATGK